MAGRTFALLGAAALAATVVAGCAHNAQAAVASSTLMTVHAAFGNTSHGAEVFRADCAFCHTANGAVGGIGPSLQREKERKTYDQTVAWIEQPDPPMPKLYPASLSKQDVDDVATYVQSL